MSDFTTSFPETLEFPRASSYTPAPGKDKERSSINWSIWNGNVQCKVWTRVDDDKVVNGKKQGPIQAGFGGEVLEAILEGAIKFWLSGVTDTIIWDNIGRPKNPDGSSSFERVVQSHFVYGRGEDGLCYYGLRSADESRPVIIFKFEGPEWHKPRRKSGSFSSDELSTMQAVSTFRYILNVTMNAQKGQTPEERKAAAERRKSNNSSNGGGSYNKKPAETSMSSGFDDGFSI